MTAVILMYIHIAHSYKYGRLKRVYGRTSKITTTHLLLSLNSPITLCFDSDLCCASSNSGGAVY